MSMKTAEALWGADAVRVALAEPNRDPVTTELLDEIKAHAAPPGLLRSWSIAQPWPRFCAIVAVVSGAHLNEVLGDG